MSSETHRARPAGITFVIVMIWIAALFNLAVGIWLMIAPLGQNPSIVDLSGHSYELPGFWLFMNGLLSVLLGVIYVWIARMTAIGAVQAQVLIQVLAVLNVVFALFRLPYGWLALVLNLLILVLVSTNRAREWFTNVDGRR
jgi:hypothetical protein